MDHLNLITLFSHFSEVFFNSQKEKEERNSPKSSDGYGYTDIHSENKRNISNFEIIIKVFLKNE